MNCNHTNYNSCYQDIQNFCAWCYSSNQCLEYQPCQNSFYNISNYLVSCDDYSSQAMSCQDLMEYEIDFIFTKSIFVIVLAGLLLCMSYSIVMRNRLECGAKIFWKSFLFLSIIFSIVYSFNAIISAIGKSMVEYNNFWSTFIFINVSNVLIISMTTIIGIVLVFVIWFESCMKYRTLDINGTSRCNIFVDKILCNYTYSIKDFVCYFNIINKYTQLCCPKNHDDNNHDDNNYDHEII